MNIRTITNPEELDRVLRPVIEASGGEVPPSNCYMAVVEFDDAGEVLAYQMIQTAVFLEGMWARDRSAHLLALHHEASRFVVEKMKATRYLTLTRDDEAGRRIATLAEKLGFERLPFTVLRRIV